MGACGDGDGGTTITVEGYRPTTTDELSRAISSLCTVADQVIVDVDEAHATFVNEAHVALHIVAGAVGPVDRERAAALLVAKQRVEADLAADDAPDTIAADVDALIAATADAAPVIDVDPPRCGA